MRSDKKDAWQIAIRQIVGECTDSLPGLLTSFLIPEGLFTLDTIRLNIIQQNQ
jgi:hypothetical protein